MFSLSDSVVNSYVTIKGEVGPYVLKLTTDDGIDIASDEIKIYVYGGYDNFRLQQ